MAVKVRCTGCDKVLTAPDASRGKAIRCPNCETKVRVPAAEEAAPKKKTAKKSDQDSNDAIASLDLRNLEDREARICPKCGYDMAHMEEEETECPKCGYDSSMGGLGERAQKRRLKGPDPDKFFSTLWKPNWKWVVKNQGLAWRTMVYTLVASMLMFLCGFLYLYIPMWPPRLFFALCTAVCALMLPGWMWFMDQEVIVGTLQKKDKLKRINFDFFLCSALGVKFVAWHAVFAVPVLGIPCLVGYMLTSMMGLPGWAFWICFVLGYLPVLAMMPIAMGHFVMPVQTPGWMVWKVAPAWLQTLKPTLIWVMLTLTLALPSIACLATIGAVYGSQLNVVVRQMEENAEIARVQAAIARTSKKDQAKMGDNPMANREFHKPAYSTFIVPAILWALACVFIGFPAMYASRLNGQFIYYFRESLDLIALAKEYKYVAKAKPDEDAEVKPKTITKMIVDAAVTAMICGLLGIVGGMVMGALSTSGNILGGMITGGFYGAIFTNLIGRFMILDAAFKDSVVWGLLVLFIPLADVAFVAKNWQEGGTGCLVQVMAIAMTFFAVILIVAGLLTFGDLGLGALDAPPADAPPAQDVAPIDPGAPPAGQP